MSYKYDKFSNTLFFTKIMVQNFWKKVFLCFSIILCFIPFVNDHFSLTEMHAMVRTFCLGNERNSFYERADLLPRGTDIF